MKRTTEINYELNSKEMLAIMDLLAKMTTSSMKDHGLPEKQCKTLTGLLVDFINLEPITEE